MKNEAAFVVEWIAYHQIIGFDRIVIFSNDSDDGTTELLDTLAAAGQIEHRLLSVPAGVGPQLNAARALNASGLLEPGGWFAWIDADEFINIHLGDGTLSALTEFMGDRELLLLQWRIFGSSGNRRFPGRLVSEDFTGASARTFVENAEVKSFFKVADRFAGFGEFSTARPMLNPGSDNRPELFLNSCGMSIEPNFPPHRRWLAGEDFPRQRLAAPRDIGWRIAQLNHYSVRTPEHFALKKTRGRGWAAPDGAAPARHNLKFFREMDRNEHTDRSILRFKDPVTERMARLRLMPGVAEAEAAALTTIHGRILEMLDREAASISGSLAVGERTD